MKPRSTELGLRENLPQFSLLVAVTAFVGAGMTNMMLFHDILDAVWVFSLALISASVPAPDRLATMAAASDRKLR